MAFKLHLPPCISNPAHPFHPPPPETPLRIQIEGPIIAIQKLLPEISWDTDRLSVVFPQQAGPEIARLAYQILYERDVCPELDNDMVVRDEYLGWVTDVKPYNSIDYYGVTFDHLVPVDDPDPDVLQINIFELEITDGPFKDGVAYANKYLQFTIDAADYTGKKVLAVPRCCQKRKGTQDRERINSLVAERMYRMKGATGSRTVRSADGQKIDCL